MEHLGPYYVGAVTARNKNKIKNKEVPGGDPWRFATSYPANPWDVGVPLIPPSLPLRISPNQEPLHGDVRRIHAAGWPPKRQVALAKLSQ